MEEPTVRQARLTDRVERVSKLALGVTGLLYVLGLLVASLHLMRFGVFSLSLVRPHYIVAGLWPVLPLAFPAALIAWTFTAWHEVHPPSASPAATTAGRLWHHVRRWNALISPAAGWIFIVVMAILYVATPGSEVPWSFRQVALGGMVVFVFFVILALLSAATWTGARGPHTALRVIRGVAFGSLLVLCLLGYLRFFVDHIYPVIPSRIGGGKPMPVTVVLKAAENVSALGLTARPGTPRALRCELILDGDKTYVLRTIDPPRAILELSKDVVAAMIVDERR
jgi:hypothetical protein